MITPVGRSGLAFFGDEGKYVSNGRQRIASLDDTKKKLTVTVAFAAGEKNVRLFGYAKKAPNVIAQSGSVGKVAFDKESQRFSVEVSPAPKIGDSGRDLVQTTVVEFESE